MLSIPGDLSLFNENITRLSSFSEKLHLNHCRNSSGLKCHHQNSFPIRAPQRPI